ncbi:MAG TPA: phytanoyl-CoA dioxygenase family protein [Bacilli bacterium]
MNVTSLKLSKEQVLQYLREGYLGPFTLCSPEEMAEIREVLLREVLYKPSVIQRDPLQSRHLDHSIVFELCSHPEITERMASIMGDDLILWRSHFFQKDPGSKDVPWHQDVNSWPMIEPKLNITAWIAIDDAFIENSCVQIIPRSHTSVVPHIPVTETKAFYFGEESDPRYVNVKDAVPMELKAGQFFLFNERMLHYSAPNTSDKRRIGLAARVTTPIVKVDHGKLFPGHKCVLIRGKDTMELNEMAEPPHIGGLKK